MFELIFIILIIVFIVKQMKKQNQGAGGTRRSTTETIYVNGKPVRVKRRQQTYSSQQTYSASQTSSAAPSYSAAQSSSAAQTSNAAQRSQAAQRSNAAPSYSTAQTGNSASPYSAAPRNAYSGQQSGQSSYGAPYAGNAHKKNAKAGAHKAGANDILARAKQNVAENDVDELKMDDMQHHQEAGGIQAAFARPESAAAQGNAEQIFGQMQGQTYHAQQNQSPEGVEEQGEDIRKQLNDLMIMGYQPKLEFKRDFVAEGVEMINRYQALGS